MKAVSDRPASLRVAMPEWLIGLRRNLSRSWGVSFYSRHNRTLAFLDVEQQILMILLAKFPQWGIAIVDGVLIDWNG